MADKDESKEGTPVAPPAEELVEDAVAGFSAERAQIGHTLYSRCGDIESGKVKLIPGEEVRAYFDAKFASRRS